MGVGVATRHGRRERPKRRRSSRDTHNSDRKRGRAPSCDSSGASSDDEDGREDMHYVFRPGDLLKSRYRTISLLGTGTFGKVVLARDELGERDVAVKIVRAIPKYASEAHVEARIVESVHERAREQHRRVPVVELYDRFDHHGHACLVSERLGLTLLEALERARTPREHGASTYLCLQQIQAVARALFQALEFIHSLGLAHTDLKPENVLFTEWPPLTHEGAALRGLRAPACFAVKLIDFGGATYEHEHHSEVVCTRQYRPPEVTLGMHWGCAVDQWSAGCILAELLTGHVLFATHDEAEHLALMERALGAIPRRMARGACERAQRRWFAHGALHWPQVAPSRESERHVREAARLKDALARDRPWTRAHDEFLSLLARLLEYQPEHRITAREALLHPFLTMDIAPGVM